MFLLDHQSKDPIFEQIQRQILHFIEAGILKPGDRLPSVRQLALDNGINPNTAAKAYAELEKAGYVNNIPKKGVYIAELDARASRSTEITALLTPLKDSGVTKKELIQAVNQLFKEDKEDAQN